MTLADIAAPRYRPAVVVVTIACTVLVGAAAAARTDVLAEVDARIDDAAAVHAEDAAEVAARLARIEASLADTRESLSRIEGILSASREKALDAAAAPR